MTSCRQQIKLTRKVPNVNCNVVCVPVHASLLGSRLIFLPVVIDRFLYVALPFSYQSVVTTKRITLTIISLWLLAFFFGILSVVDQEYNLVPRHGICICLIKRGNGSFLFSLLMSGSLVVSMIIITVICIYLCYKIIHLNRFFQSVKRTAAEEQKAVKIGKLAEFLQEQVKPSFLAFMAGGIDAIFNVLGIILFFLGGLVDSELYIRDFIIIIVPLQICRHIVHAVVYAMRDNVIREEILQVYQNIRGPKKSKVITLNGH